MRTHLREDMSGAVLDGHGRLLDAHGICKALAHVCLDPSVA